MSQSMAKAREHMLIALELLDDSHAPADIGAHLDFAICRLNEKLGTTKFQAQAGTSLDERRHNPRLH